MKKLLIAICMLLSIVTVSNAQTTTAKQTKPKTTKTKTTAAGPLKKNGTPDMRYKANKKAAAPAKS